MNRRIVALFSIVLLAPSLSFADDSAAIAEAQTAATAWLALTDEAKYEESWEQSSSLFRSAVSKADWAKALGGARSPLGGTKDRELKNSTFTRSLPGAPEGEYVVIQFETEFENRSAVETVTQVREEDGAWRIGGYFVK